jgi:hypothetical protein
LLEGEKDERGDEDGDGGAEDGCEGPAASGFRGEPEQPEQGEAGGPCGGGQGWDEEAFGDAFGEAAFEAEKSGFIGEEAEVLAGFREPWIEGEGAAHPEGGAGIVSGAEVSGGEVVAEFWRDAAAGGGGDRFEFFDGLVPVACLEGDFGIRDGAAEGFG